MVLKVPFSDINLFGVNSDPIYIFGKDSPKRGDVIVFKFPKDKSINYIKRVIALPGDKIEIKNKVVFVNDSPIKLSPWMVKKLWRIWTTNLNPLILSFMKAILGLIIMLFKLMLKTLPNSRL